MKQFDLIRTFMENCKAAPDDIAIVDVSSGGRLSYGALYELSGRVYHYLLDHKIGKEDVVMILLPRGAMPFVALTGVWRAGAAFVMLETDYPEEKRNFIIQHANCRLVIDRNVFSEMMEYTAMEGYTPADPHDLAYILYTSGSTGEPKGVLHEYGTQKLCIKGATHDGDPLFQKGDRSLLLSPLNFTATIMMYQPVLYSGATIVVMPLSQVRNIEKLNRILIEHHITVGFFTPSLLKAIPAIPQSMKKMIIGAEPARNIYYDIPLFSKYGQSESGFSILSFRIDQSYETAPAGKPMVPEAEVCLLDENGNPVSQGECGEICYKNPYFRGYLGLPEKNREAFIHGYTRSGDLGKQLPDGNYLVLGRNDDMIKINGNRVEPAEIEKTVKKILQVDWVGARAFTEKGRSFICVYYAQDLPVDLAEAKKVIRRKLPSYMVPSYYIRIDHIPISPNGKFRRRDLPAPDPESYQQEYAAPRNDTEKQLCEAMAQVLGLENIGIFDDFYEIGGDSISSIRLLTSLNWDLLDAAMLYQGRTAAGIAALYTQARSQENSSLAERNLQALLRPQPLSGEQIYMFDYQCYLPRSVVWNLPVLLRFARDVDLDRVKQAVDTTLKAHPVFSTVYLFDEDTRLVQKYDPYKCFNTPIEDITEREFLDVAETLVQPYRLIKADLYRARLFRTERGGYLFLDMHHSISDGTSLHILIEDICKAYQGKALEPDYYYLSLEERKKARDSHLYEEGKAYYEQKLDQQAWITCLCPDNDTGKNIYGNTEKMIPIDDVGYDAIRARYGLGKNAFYIMVSLIALKIYNQKDNIRISWVYNGRQNLLEQHVIGTLIKGLYVGVNVTDTLRLSELCKEVADQVEKGIYYSVYPYPGAERINDEGEDASLIYQSDLRSLQSMEGLHFTVEKLPGTTDSADNLLDIEIHETPEGCKLYMDYNAAAYKKDSISRFRKLFLKTACCLIEKTETPDCTIGDIIKDII